MTTEEWKPRRVVQLDNENRGLQREREQHADAIKEIDAKIAANNAAIQEEYSHGARG